MIILSNAEFKMLATYLYIWNLAMLMAYAVTIQGVCEDATFPGKPFFYDGDVVKAAPGTKLTVHCKQEYMENSPTVQCIDGKWTDPVPPCEEVQCELPHFPDHASPTMRCRQFRCSTTYKCDDGYWYNGTETIFCQRDNKWNGEPGICLGAVCPKLTAPVHGQIIQPDLSYGANATITCDEGYIYSNPNQSVRWCVGSGVWSGDNGTCEAVICPKLPDPIQGKVLQPERSYDSTATVECHEGYNYTGPATRVCLGNNSWSGDEGECTVNHCPNLSDVAHGILSANTGKFTDTVNIHCATGFTLDGPYTIQCQANGKWSTHLGNCRKSENPWQSLLIATIITSVLVPVVGVSACLLVWYACKRYQKSKYRSVSTHDEEIGLTTIPGITKLYCTFIMDEEFKEHLEFRTSGCESFPDLVTRVVNHAIVQEIDDGVDVTVTHLSPESKTVYLELQLGKPLPTSTVEDVIDKAKFESTNEENIVYHVQKNSILFRERITHFLAAGIDVKRHAPDKTGDRRIDIDKQYVRLKMLSHKSMKPMQRDGLERPDLYQRSLEKHRGRDISDEDLITNRDTHNFILIRGRAGIGKSTLIQRLLWKWSTGKWATQMKAIFLLNMRYLITHHRKMDLCQLLCLYSLYTTREDGVIIDSDWLEKNQQRLGIVIDGIDEVRDFSELWDKSIALKTPGDSTTPLEWCFVLIKRAILENSTILISSRPYADLGLILKNLEEQGMSKKLMIVELMGLTHDRVFEFAEKNAGEKKVFVKHTLMKNPILMSVCAITFYCAALCKLLVDQDVTLPKLTTYTQITAYILKLYVDRSSDMLKESSTKTKKYLSASIDHLMTIASEGLLNPGPSGLPRLIFEDKDFKLESGAHQRTCMRQTGLLMDTNYEDPHRPGQITVLSQFVHLSIQEFLAMIGVIKSKGDGIEMVIKQLCRSQQFNMALVFLYGLAFDESIPGHLPFCDLCDTSHTRKVLLDLVSNLTDPLQAMQIALESQSVDVARRVGKHHFENEVSISRTKLTAIDIISMIWVLRHCPSTHTIKLNDVGIDLTSMREIAGYLEKENTIKTFELDDDNINDDCMRALMDGIKYNTTLTSLTIWSNAISSLGIKHLADTLKANRKLEGLSIISEGITDPEMEIISEGLMQNDTLKRLSLSSSKITDVGVEHVALGVARNSTLRELKLVNFRMGDRGGTAVLNLLKDKKNLRVSMEKPHCNTKLLSQLTYLKQIEMLK